MRRHPTATFAVLILLAPLPAAAGCPTAEDLDQGGVWISYQDDWYTHTYRTGPDLVVEVTHYGDGSALMMMKTRYGSDEGARVMREFQEHLANRAYQASARLAEEKGAFPLFDKDEYLNSPFVQRLSDETREMIGDLGLRNSHLLSIQPTGNTSTLGNAPSSGIEPVFMHSYIRTAEQPALPDELSEPEMSPRAYSATSAPEASRTVSRITGSSSNSSSRNASQPG